MKGHQVSLVVDEVQLQTGDGPLVADRVVGIRLDGVPLDIRPGSPVVIDTQLGEAGWAVTFTILANELGQVDP